MERVLTPVEKVTRAFPPDRILNSRQVMDPGVKYLLSDGRLDSIALVQTAAVHQEVLRH
jgi:hypothetical protein